MQTLARRASLFPIALALFAGACSISREAELASVAKDWCLAIRASQVMPVYPLTQDVQPGDVFLVRVPIDQQQREWQAKGYLALDNHLARLDPAGYADFYRHSFPPDAGPATGLPLRHLRASPPWSTAPHAGFPTYGFSVKKGGGLNLALPVSGVPIGLGLLGASSAEGTISIGKARTLGVDMISLDAQLRTWAGETKNRSFLVGLASTGSRKNYVRVVTRVYLTGELDVSLRDTTDRSFGVDVGMASPVAALVPKVAETTATTAQAAATNYKAAIEQLNEMLEGQDRTTTDAAGKTTLVPGGSLRLTAATARTIAMKENFDPPLVLGYLGFDCEIGPGGQLGPAVPTYAVVTGQLGGEAFVGGSPAGQAWLDQFWVSAYEIARTRSPSDAAARDVVARCDQLGRFVPPQWQQWSSAPGGSVVETSVAPTRNVPYLLFRQYWSSLEDSANDLTEALSRPTFRLERDGVAVDVAKDSDEARRLAALRDGMRFQLGNEQIVAAHAEARRALADWMFVNLYTRPGN